MRKNTKPHERGGSVLSHLFFYTQKGRKIKKGDSIMKKQTEIRYFVTSVASIPVYKVPSKTEMYRMAAKDGWGTVYRDEENNLVCDEDCSADLYTKDGGYFGITPYEEINTKEMPKQAECAAIICSDSCGYSV